MLVVLITVQIIIIIIIWIIVLVPWRNTWLNKKFSTNLEIISRYRPWYRDNTRLDIRVCPYIAFSDIVSPRHNIVSFFLMSDPILVISAPISVQYWNIPVPCQTRYYQYRAWYRGFPRYRLRYRVNIGTYPFLAKPDIGFFTDFGPYMVPILQKVSGYTDIGTKKPRYRSRCHSDVYAISQYTNIVSLLRLRPLGPPAAQALTRRPLSKRSNWSSLLVLSSADQRGSALGTAYILAHSVLLQKKALVSDGATYSKLETGIIEFQVASFVTVVADIRGARYLLRVWWAWSSDTQNSVGSLSDSELEWPSLRATRAHHYVTAAGRGPPLRADISCLRAREP